MASIFVLRSCKDFTKLRDKHHGIPTIVVSRRLGHANASITMNTYGHLMPGFQREAADLMDSLITPINVTSELK